MSIQYSEDQVKRIEKAAAARFSALGIPVHRARAIWDRHCERSTKLAAIADPARASAREAAADKLASWLGVQRRKA